MIECLIGEIVQKNPAYVVLKIGGIAFKLLTPLSTYESLPAKGEVKIFTEFYMSASAQENSVRIYGFTTIEERKLFQLLCTVQRVGPTTALQILSGISVSDFRQAVLSENIRYLEKIKGVGNKTAQRIIIELKEAFSTWLPKAPHDKSLKDKGDLITDAVLALVSLGYPRLSAEKAVQKATKNVKEKFTAEDLVKKSLRQI